MSRRLVESKNDWASGQRTLAAMKRKVAALSTWACKFERFRTHTTQKQQQQLPLKTTTNDDDKYQTKQQGHKKCLVRDLRPVRHITKKYSIRATVRTGLSASMLSAAPKLGKKPRWTTAAQHAWMSTIGYMWYAYVQSGFCKGAGHASRTTSADVRSLLLPSRCYNWILLARAASHICEMRIVVSQKHVHIITKKKHACINAKKREWTHLST